MRFSYPLSDQAWLAPLAEKDALAIFRETEQSRSYLREFLPWLDSIKSVDDTRKFIDAELRRCLDQRCDVASIWYQGDFAGIVSLYNLNWPNRSAAIGYWLGQRFQGHGLMTQAVRVLVDNALNQMRLNRIEIRAHVENIRSQKIAKRLGFSHEGTLKEVEWLYDRYVDHELFAMTKGTWEATNKG
ncbi:MAG: GNAT family N-acetyltransferase [Opitutales bacterium]|nr:GNAT family N-acetyltransferase [Opitutales bacterium]NRA28413.1 GNAT family N-acetyltransferase [Opitutales bacterium]